MDTIRRSISAEELRGSVADVLDGVAERAERVGVTHRGKLTAVVISVDDLELLEELEAARDAAEFAAAKAAGDGERVSLEELRAEVE
jgi:prevent-host-death family protein